jgi:hypothetical protein
MAGAGRQIRDFSRDCKRAGSPTAAGLSRKMRRKLIASATPVKQAVQRNALAIPAVSGYHTGLRAALAAATRISVSPMATRVAVVRLIVDGKKMPAGQQSLPPYMEGDDGFRSLRWRHPVFGPHNSTTWSPQDSHRFVAPAVIKTVPVIERGMVAAVDEAIAELKGL